VTAGSKNAIGEARKRRIYLHRFLQVLTVIEHVVVLTDRCDKCDTPNMLLVVRGVSARCGLVGGK
jgi:hypothetical protein